MQKWAIVLRDAEKRTSSSVSPKPSDRDTVTTKYDWEAGWLSFAVVVGIA